MRLIAAALLGLLTVLLPAADRLELTNGDVISGAIVRLDESTIVIETEYGRLEIDRSRVLRGFLVLESGEQGTTRESGQGDGDSATVQSAGDGRYELPRSSSPSEDSPDEGQDAELRAGLLMHLPFDGSLGDTTQNYIPANNGMRFVTDVTGRPNGALRSDGGGTFLSIASDERLKRLDQFSVSFWIRLDDSVPTHYLLSKWTRAQGETAEGTFTIQTSRGGITLFLVDSTGRYHWVSAPGSLADGEWEHVAVTFGGGRAVIYVNGEQRAARRFAFDRLYADDAPLLIMTAEADQENRYGLYNSRGAIDDLRLYNRALSSMEVASLAGVPGAPRE